MALYSGSWPPLQTGEQCLLHVEASHHPHTWKGHMSAFSSALEGYSKISTAQKALAFLCGILETVNRMSNTITVPTGGRSMAGKPGLRRCCLAGPVGELSTVPSVKGDFMPEGGPPPSSLWKISPLSALPTEQQNATLCPGEEAGGKDRLATMTFDTICSNESKGGQLCSLLSLSLFLVASGFSCVTWASLVAVHGISYPLACGILVPWPGIEPASPHWEADS